MEILLLEQKIMVCPYDGRPCRPLPECWSCAPYSGVEDMQGLEEEEPWDLEDCEEDYIDWSIEEEEVE